MHLELTEQERFELLDLIKIAQGETAAEIHHAMDHDFREQLRHRRDLLDGLIKRLSSSAQLTR